MIVNGGTLQALYTGFKMLFNKGLESVQTFYQELCTEVPSSNATEEYKWLGRFPKMREWIGDKQFQNLEAHGYSIKNKDWEASVEVDRNDIEDDNVGLYNPLFTSMGEEAKRHYDVLAMALLLNGFSTACYDGQYFFDTDHPVNGAPVTNTGTEVLSADNYAAARAKMRDFTDDRGRPLYVNPNLLVVGPSNEATAKKIIEAEFDSSGATNPWKGTAKLLVLSGLGTKWFLMDTTRAIKPLVIQIRKKPVMVSKVTTDSEAVFQRKAFQYSVECRDNGGYAFWQLAYGSTGAGQQ
jgi:phage major head subunit gpT-like protein